jgi:hypothetical protein
MLPRMGTDPAGQIVDACQQNMAACDKLRSWTT